ncbi:MAG: tetratricopeptide repeat protein [Nitrospirota bacterium]
MDSQELLKQAQVLLAEGKDAESADAFTKALEAGADPYICYLSRGVAYIKMQEIDKAVDDFSQAANANSQSPRAYLYRGMAYMMKVEFENAVADFTRALELKTDFGMAMFARGVSYARLGRFEEASRDMMTVMPQMEQNLQSFADSYGIVRTEMWKVMAQLSGEAKTPTLDLNEKDMNTLKKWLGDA